MNKLQEILEQLRTLDWNEPGRWPLGVRLGAAALLFMLAAAGGYYYFVWDSLHPQLVEARAKEADLFDTLEQKARKAANLQAYKDQLADMEKSFGAMLRQLPNKTEVPNLLVDISQTGLAAGLQEKLFQPQNEIRKDFYAELPITIRLTGGYHQMGEFAAGVAALPRIVTLHDIEIAPGGKNAGGDLTLNVTAKTYRYLDEEEQAAADSGTSDVKGKSGKSKGKSKAKAGKDAKGDKKDGKKDKGG
ncbi:MAG: type 4a pilus biogenesis protein PilO [Steroidobacteraceae bacterium]